MTGPELDRAIQEVAARQETIVTTAQLRELGLRPGAVQRRCARGWLRRMGHGLYAVGESPLARQAAALLSAGDGATLVYASAAAHWDLMREPARVHVAVPHHRRPRDNELRVIHRIKLGANEVATPRDLRVTTPLRTLRDIAPLIARPTFERAVNEALVLRLITSEQAERLVGYDQPPNKREAERRLRRFLHRAGLPPDRMNAIIAGNEVDVVYEREKLLLELDGFQFHGHRIAFERDRRRDARFMGLGYRVLRVTWNQLTKEPEATAVLIARALAP